MNTQIFNKLKLYIDLILEQKLSGINFTDQMLNTFDLTNSASVTSDVFIDMRLKMLQDKFNTLFPYDNKNRLNTKECQSTDIIDPYRIILQDENGNNIKPTEYINIGDWEDRQCPSDVEYENTSNKRLIVYYPEWAIYDLDFPLKKYAVENVSEISYAFCGIKGMVSPYGIMPTYSNESAKRDLFGVQVLDRYASLQITLDSDDTTGTTMQRLKGNMAELIRMKKKFPDKVVTLSLGGWSLSDTYHLIMYNSCTIKKAVENIIKFIKVFDFFDVIDLDFEFPGGEGFTVYNGYFNDNEMQNYSLFIHELNTALQKINKKLSVTLGVDKSHIKHLNIDVLNSVYSVNLMTYDFYGSWDLSSFGFNSSLYAYPTLDQERSIDWVTKYFINKGLKSTQLTIGIPAYGRGWQGLKPLDGKDKLTLEDILSGNVDTSEVIPFQYGTLGLPTLEEGYASYTDITDMIENNNGRDGFFAGIEVNYSKSGYFIDQETGSFMTYDTANTVTEKGKYIIDNNLGGAIIWEASVDKKFDIINGLNKGLGNKTK